MDAPVLVTHSCECGATLPSSQTTYETKTAYTIERAERTPMFSSRKKPLYAVNFHSEGSRSCTDTSDKSTRLSLRASDVTSSSELEHSKRASGAMERSARDLTRMDKKPLLNLAALRLDRCSRRQASEDSNHNGDSPNALCPIRTGDHSSPETK